MSERRDWFRNRFWNAEIEAAFVQKLGRARKKAQYLRIQACELAPHNPKIALRLLDQYFALNEDFDRAQAYVDRATAFLALGDTEAAVSAYEGALAREIEFPNVRTRAWLDLPFLIAREKLSIHYDRALALLEIHKKEVMFPIDHFLWHCVRALIFSERGEHSASREAARSALAASAVTHSGFRYHSGVGLANNVDKKLVHRLEILTGNR